MSGEKHEGHILIRTEPPDAYFVAFVGDISEDVLLSKMRELRVYTEGKPYVLAINDLTKMRSITAAARNLAVEEGKHLPLRGTAIVGASFQLRVLATLANKALSLLSKKGDYETRFFDTEAEARAWINERRRALSKENG